MAIVSVYQDLIDMVIAGHTAIIDKTEDFNLASFRSAFYRYCDTDFGKMLKENRQLSVKQTSEQFIIQMTEPKKIQFKLSSRELTNGQDNQTVL